MKILFHEIINKNKFTAYGNRLDFQADCLFHGFRSLFGIDCIDYPKMEHMYKENFDKVKTDKCKGFSLYNRLDDIDIDRNNIEEKVTDKYFDCIIVLAHHSTNYDYKVILPVVDNLSLYSQIALIDGSDNGNIPDLNHLNNKIKFFKRENYYNDPKIHSVSFGIPEENIVKEIPNKDKDFASIMPSYINRGHPHEKTYIYNNEDEYNTDYQRSYFAFTCNKGGWDCLRHYEILANSCIPYFTDIEKTPLNILNKFPKRLCTIAKQMDGVCPNWISNTHMGTCMDLLHTYNHYIDHNKFNHALYFSILNLLMEYTHKYLTTKKIAQRVLNVL